MATVRNITKNRIVARIFSRFLLALIIIIAITGVITHYHSSEIATELANRLLSPYGIFYANIVVDKLQPSKLKLNEIEIQGSMVDENSIAYTVLAKNINVTYDLDGLLTRRVNSVQIEKLEIKVRDNTNVRTKLAKQITTTDPLRITQLFFEEWRESIPVDNLNIKQLTITFTDETLSERMIGFPVLTLSISIDLGPDKLTALSVMTTNDRPPITLIVNTDRSKENHIQLTQNSKLVFDFKFQPGAITPAEQNSLNFNSTAQADFAFLLPTIKTLFNPISVNASPTDSHRPGFPQIPSLPKALDDLSIAGTILATGTFTLPTLIADFSLDTITWTGSSAFDIDVSLPSQGLSRLRSSGEIDSTWDNTHYTARITQPFSIIVEPDWSYFKVDNSMLTPLKLSNKSTISANVSRGAEFQITQVAAFNFRSDNRVSLSVNDTFSRTHYSASFSAVNAHFLNDFELDGKFDFQGSTRSMELPFSSTVIKLRHTDTQLLVELNNHIPQFDGDMSTQLFMPFDSNDASLKISGTFNKLSNLQQFAETFMDIPDTLVMNSGSLLFSLDVQGDENVSDLSKIETLRKTISLTIRAASLQYDDILVKGINGNWALSGTQVMTSETPALLSVDSLDIGLPLTKTLFRFNTQFDFMRYFYENQLSIILDFSLFESHLLGGRLYNHEPFTLDPLIPRGDIVLGLTNLQLTEILALQQLEGLDGFGSLNGTFPVTIREKGIQIKNGKLDSVAPGGEIHYVLDDARKEMVAKQDGLSMTTDILENFHFNELNIGITFLTDGQTTLANHFQGKNPDKFDGTPINLNLNLDLNVFKLLKSLRLTEEIGENVEDKFSH